ncbi:MAG: hypothetical protein JW744_04950 [Candidatus Diapherotrites archaeon]|uniref:AbrB/MazE/SpoVT family DNA-binding domain-containing protein n=1 Tax=Candidatus Iainarchaeum sp. TaxID=3101447 RepID=A0A939CAH8_9ARCH|nr:hypothetical protein [Candidatus Diapherotrites archaeon]
MKTVTIDRTGKIYLPKEVREKIEGKEYIVSVLPDGEIRLHQWTKPKDALKSFRGLIKSRKSVKEIKKDILETAMEQAD